MHASLLLSLAAVARIAAANALPGAFLCQFNDHHDPDAILGDIQAVATMRMWLDYTLFKGVSFLLHSVMNESSAMEKVLANPGIDTCSQIYLHDAPRPMIEQDELINSAKRSVVRRDAVAANETEDNYSPHVMTQVNKLRAAGFTGKGVKIAIIDTGIDYMHPALGGCFGENCLVSFGADLVGDAFDGTNMPHPDPYPLEDCNGHGTAVAGVIAAQPNELGFTGAVPNATIGMYRVFGCQGFASDDVIVAAFNQAYEDDADIISASIGESSGWSGHLTALAAQRIVEKGVPCVASMGNDGSKGLFNAATLASGKGVTAVAKFSNHELATLLHVVKYSIDDGEDVQFGYYPTQADKWDDVTLELYALSTDDTILDSKHDACSELPDTTPDLSNNIVLTRVGNCFFSTQAANLAAKGARYIIVYNDINAAYEFRILNVPEVLAAGMVLKYVGENWIEALENRKKVTLKMASSIHTGIALISNFDNLTAGSVGPGTTWGPTWEMDVKPQVGAPGDHIITTAPMSRGGYRISSGTSMACPLVASIIALVGQVRRTFNPALINSLLSSTANPQLFYANPSRYINNRTFETFYAPVPQQGGGIVQAYDAAYATTLLEPYSLSFNDTDHFSKLAKVKINNTGDREITYNLSNVPAVTMYTLDPGSTAPSDFPNEFVQAAAVLQFSQDTITLGPNTSTTFQVRPTPPSGLDAKRLPLWSGWIAVNGTDGSSLSIPYQGLSGSLRSSTVLRSNSAWVSNSNKWNQQATNVTFFRQKAGQNNSTGAQPFVVANLTLGTSILTADVVPVTSVSMNTTTRWGFQTIGQPFGFPLRTLSRGPYLRRWDGRVESGDHAPEGEYKLVVRALRIFGDANTEADWDVSVTSSFHIHYQ
ncbi:subtilisin-like serine protease PR1C [Drechmeria coniospora]|uniref:Subtilisin-like serine protease PR1C n=1 Tax=Drechmeria coniospora TaxID=98403 RepID=A0A151GPD7_DRECN|nr:subtilisin-like serine protease PR1C [Drechmeria coniospora]KYK58956.1 subtilisin-like serine protease PR1C [Drechmeria coniospora]